MPTTHPTAGDLAAFVAGRANPVVSAEIERHLIDCSACCQAMLALHDDDAFVRGLRSAAAAPRPDFGPDASGIAARFAPTAQPTIPPFDDETLPGAQPSETAPAGVPAVLLDHPRYRVVRRLGDGGMGSVYLAEHRLMNRLVAIKLVRPELVRNPACVERFRREVQAAARLSHPNIVTAYDAEHVGDLHLLVMEYVPGMDLLRCVRERGPLPIAEACEYARQAALGLQHAADHGLVHRDIKPQNLMLTQSGTVKILDFGLASFVVDRRDADGLTGDGAIMGTPDYIAPEQARDARRADIRADIYSLGCTLRYLLTGQVLRPDGTALEKIMAHVEQSAAPLAAMRADVPDELQDVLDRMTARRPEDRYQSPAEVAAALAPRAMSGRPTTSAGSSVSRRQRHPAIVLVGIGLFGLLAWGAYSVMRVVTDRGTLRIESTQDVQVVLSQEGREVRILDVASGSQVIRLPSGEYEASLRGGDVRMRLEQAGFTLERGGEAVVIVRPVPPAVPQPAELHKLAGHKEWVMGVAFAPHGRELATAAADHTLKFWDPAAGGEARSIDAHGDDLRAVAYSADGLWIATAAHDEKIKLWDAATKELKHELPGHDGPVTSLAFDPTGAVLYSGGDDGAVRRWDVATHSAAGEPLRLMAAVSAVACSPDGSVVAAGGKDRNVTLCDARLQPIQTLSGHADEVRSLAFSHRGDLLASGSKDGTVRLWDVAARSFQAMLSPYEGRVYGVAFSPDDRWLAAGGGDWGWGSVRLWDVATRQPLTTLTGHTAFVHCVAFSPDGTLLATGAGDWSVRIWRLGAAEANSDSAENSAER
jgi:WD40 repeat protein